MKSLFDKIITGEIPSYKIADTCQFLAFLDMYPIVKGHTLIIPKKKKNDVFDLDDDTLAEMIIFAKKVSHAMRKVIDCKKIGAMVIGLKVPHAHIHLIPINREEDLYFHSTKETLTPEKMEAIATSISNVYHKTEKKKNKLSSINKYL